jgi:Carbohydrate binding module (family 6)/Glycosyl hydrolases family 16
MRALPASKPTRRAVAVLTVTALAAASIFFALESALSAAAGAVPPPPAGWATVFSDGFTGPAGSGVDSNWTYDQGSQYSGTGCTGSWGTGEVETDTDSTANVAEDGNGNLDINPVDSGGTWTSGRIETEADNFEAPPGGEMEVSASIEQPNPASGTGYWPAFWMLGAGFRASGAGTAGTMDCSNWPSDGEIDVMEDVNALSEVSGTLHCGVDPGGPCNETEGDGSGLQACSGCQNGFNTYSVIVNRTNTSDESITWYLNGNAYYTVTESQVGTSAWQAAVDHGFFLILDVAVGGGYPDGVCGCSSPTIATSSGAAMTVSDVAVYTTTGSSGGGYAPSAASTVPSSSPDPIQGDQRQFYKDVEGPCSTTATAYISADCYGYSNSAAATEAAAGDSDPPGVDGNQVAQLSDGDYLEYGGVNFGSGSTQFDAQVASGAGYGVSGLVEVVLDNPDNPPVGSFAVASTGGWTSWQLIPANIAEVTGTHNVYLEFDSAAPGDPPFVSLHYFSFPAS